MCVNAMLNEVNICMKVKGKCLVNVIKYQSNARKAKQISSNAGKCFS